MVLGVSMPICASICVSCAFYLSNCFSVHSFYFIQVCCFVFICSYYCFFTLFIFVKTALSCNEREQERMWIWEGEKDLGGVRRGET